MVYVLLVVLVLSDVGGVSSGEVLVREARPPYLEAMRSIALGWSGGSLLVDLV